jgi:hypothetical protein
MIFAPMSRGWPRCLRVEAIAAIRQGDRRKPEPPEQQAISLDRRQRTVVGEAQAVGLLETNVTEGTRG